MHNLHFPVCVWLHNSSSSSSCCSSKTIQQQQQQSHLIDNTNICAHQTVSSKVLVLCFNKINTNNNTINNNATTNNANTTNTSSGSNVAVLLSECVRLLTASQEVLQLLVMEGVFMRNKQKGFKDQNKSRYRVMEHRKHPTQLRYRTRRKPYKYVSQKHVVHDW
eukprot:GHVS01077830.1.p2 GENE.GHVS01077830.1~~GHVS01077830.1.p2  ORF type:complete len:164 (-),score=55.24 GHVS01077830.1:196-687(-)